jgi:hypothetical protein
MKWLAYLADLGLVENLGYLPGRRTITWQILPDLYRLWSTTVDTSGLESTDVNTGNGAGEESTPVDTNSSQPWTPLVYTNELPLESTTVDTNTRTPENLEENTRLTPRSEAEEDRETRLDIIHDAVDSGRVSRSSVVVLANGISNGPISYDDIDLLTTPQLFQLADEVLNEITH